MPSGTKTESGGTTTLVHTPRGLYLCYNAASHSTALAPTFPVSVSTVSEQRRGEMPKTKWDVSPGSVQFFSCSEYSLEWLSSCRRWRPSHLASSTTMELETWYPKWKKKTQTKTKRHLNVKEVFIKNAPTTNKPSDKALVAAPTQGRKFNTEIQWMHRYAFKKVGLYNKIFSNTFYILCLLFCFFKYIIK